MMSRTTSPSGVSCSCFNLRRQSRLLDAAESFRVRRLLPAALQCFLDFLPRGRAGRARRERAALGVQRHEVSRVKATQSFARGLLL